MTMLPAIILFAATYVLMIAFGKYRPYIALASGVLFIIFGMLPVSQIIGALDFNVLLMIGGTMGLVQLFIDSRMPERLADMIMNKVPNVQWAAVALSLFSGIISAFVDNVATVLMVAPVAIEICKKLKTNPIPFIISIAVSSNLQGAATLVGDTTAIMLGSALDMTFMDFFWYKGRPGIFFAVELFTRFLPKIVAISAKDSGEIGAQKSSKEHIDKISESKIFDTSIGNSVFSAALSKKFAITGFAAIICASVGLIPYF